MDNRQISANDGSWTLFADWQGVTRIASPGDKIKTDASLDRPNETKPLVLRPNGNVWLDYSTDVDPVALKKVSPAARGHHSPDPLGGPELVVAYDGGSVKVREETLTLAPEGAALMLGGTPRRRLSFAELAYNVFPDGSLVVLGRAEKQPFAALVAREADGRGRVVWCRPVDRVPNGDADAFRRKSSVVLADRDIVNDVAWLCEVHDDGSETVAHTHAIAGPWVHDELVWWQPDEGTVCCGAALGEPTETFALPAEHAGQGRVLRVPGRRLFLPWHGVALVDLSPPKKGKAELSRKHKAADEPMYKAASSLLRPIREAMARRGVDVAWRGVVRSGKRIEPSVVLRGRSDLVAHLLASALQYGGKAALASVGVTSVSVAGGSNYDEVLKPLVPTTAHDVRQLFSMLDAAGISRASVCACLPYLPTRAAQDKVDLPWNREVEALLMAMILSGIRGEAGDTVAPATPEAMAEAVPLLRDHERMSKAGIPNSAAAQFLAFAGHRVFGAEAAAPLMSLLEALNPTFPGEVLKALGLPFTPYVSPVVPELPLGPEEERIVAELEAVLTKLGLDAKKSREGRGWYRFELDGLAFQAGLHDDLRVVGTLCKTSTDVNLTKLMARVRAANASKPSARFFESDGYLHVRASSPLGEATAARIEGLIAACRETLSSDQAGSLAREYRTME